MWKLKYSFKYIITVYNLSKIHKTKIKRIKVKRLEQTNITIFSEA